MTSLNIPDGHVLTPSKQVKTYKNLSLVDEIGQSLPIQSIRVSPYQYSKVSLTPPWLSLTTLEGHHK